MQIVPKRLKEAGRFWVGLVQIRSSLGLPVIGQAVGVEFADQSRQIVNVVGFQRRPRGVAGPARCPSLNQSKCDDSRQNRCDFRWAVHGFLPHGQIENHFAHRRLIDADHADIDQSTRFSRRSHSVMAIEDDTVWCDQHRRESRAFRRRSIAVGHPIVLG